MQPALVGARPRAVEWLDSPRGAFARGVRGVLAFVTWCWLVEAAQDAAFGVHGARVQGLLLALFVGLAGALPLALLVGVVGRASSPTGMPEGGGRPARAWAWLWTGGAEVQRARVGAVCAAVLLGAPGAIAAFEATHRIVLGVARPRSVALAVLGVYAALALLGVWLYPAARRLGDAVVRAAARVRVSQIVFGSAGRLLVACVLVASALLAVLAVHAASALPYLPWRGLAAFAVAGVGTAAWPSLARRLPHVLTRALRGSVALVWLASAATTLLAGSSLAAARAVAIETRVGALGYAAFGVALDFDRDGHLGMLGGGDCAPFDASRSPSAVDIPDNRIDEDCDGADLGKGMLSAMRTRRTWPVPAEVPEKPPVVLLTIDAFAAAKMGALGGPVGLTPKLDALARRATLFTRCFSQGPSTRLSFPSIFTSRWDSEIRQELVGRHPYPIRASEDLLAERLAGAGYDTVAVLPDAYFGKGRWASLTQGFRSVVDRPYTTRPQPPHNAALVSDAAIEVVRARRDGPLFLWVHYYDAHSPHARPKDIASRGAGRAADYEAELALVDREAGRLLDTIEKELPGALVVVTADHGIAFDEPRHAQFNYGYDLHTGVLHVPLVVSAPFVRRQRLEEIVSTMDVTPTLTNLLRLAENRRDRGASLVPELLDGRETRPQRLHHQFFLQERLWKDEEPLEAVALRTDRYNLIHDRLAGTWSLYDWTRDYHEIEDLSHRAEHREAFQALKQQLSLLTYEVHRGRGARAERAEGP